MFLLMINLLVCSFSLLAQHKATKKHTVKKNTKIITQPAAGIYSNSQAYYDSVRGGYVFLNGGKETFQPALPPVPKSNQPRTAVPISKGLELDLYPQQHYPANNPAANSH